MISNNKRIAKNTLFLYFRMLLTMGVSLYTVRVVLETLGVVDYGIYNVVGGIVSMLSFFSGTMATASQRFFAFELGRNNQEQLNKTFSAIITLYSVLAIVILLLAETIGMWFLNTQMTIPAERMSAAYWVYQFSVLSFMFTMFTVPYNASIIAHENMKVYAYVSIVEVLLKLGIVYFLVLFSFDKLKLFAVLMFSVTVIISLIYRIYCTRNFEECRFSFYWDKNLYKEIVGYSGWNLFGALAGMFNGQGINIVLNLFFGPTVNAARGIAFQVNGAINNFVQNFMVAARPQITKYYAAGEKDEMLTLVFKSSKFSYYLLFLLSMPILIETHFVFLIWLREVPDYVILFTRLIIITGLIDSLSYPLMAAAQATGKVKVYQSLVGSVMLLSLPISYVFLYWGYAPETVFYIGILNSIICLFLRLILLKRMVNLSISVYIREVLLPIIGVSLLSYLAPLVLYYTMKADWFRFIVIGFVGVIITLVSIYTLGLLRSERIYLSNKIKAYIYKK